MDGLQTTIRPVRVTDLWAITRMTYANMTGVDQYFTRLVKNPLYRRIGYLTFPFYFLFSGRGYKALRGRQIAGCAFLHLRQKSGFVFNVSVNREFRRQGVARQLMTHLECETRANHREWSALQVDDVNMAAQRLYAHLGYRPYHPHYLRRDAPGPINRAVLTGLALEPLSQNNGRRLFTRYLKIEQEAGDAWVSPVIGEYNPPAPGSGRFFGCRLYDDEIGCVWKEGDEDWPMIRVALKPDYWGHITISGLIKMVVDKLDNRPLWIDVRFASSAHHTQAEPLLEAVGFTGRKSPRILMFKQLA